MNKPLSSRIVWIDALRGAAMVLVVLGHTLIGFLNGGVVEQTFSMSLWLLFIYSFHMPVFFFLSGLVSSDQRKAVKPFLTGLGLYVIYPYILWSALLVAFQHAVPGGANKPIPWESLLTIGWAPIAVFWFLYVFAAIKVVDYALSRWIGERDSGYALLMVGVGVSTVLALGDVNVGLVGKFAVCLGFYMAGRVLAFYGLRNLMALLAEWRMASFGLGLSGLAVLFGLAWWLAMMPGLAGPLPEFQRWVLLTGLIGTASLTLLFIQLEVYRKVLGWMAVVGAFSMVIYVQHVFWGAGIRFVAKKAGLGMLPVGLVMIVVGGILLPIIWQKVADRLGITPLFGIRKVG